MGAAVLYLLMLPKYSSSKQKILKQIQVYPLSLGNIPRDFSGNNTRKKGVIGCVYDFAVDCKAFDTSNITNVYKYLMKNMI